MSVLRLNLTLNFVFCLIEAERIATLFLVSKLLGKIEKMGISGSRISGPRFSQMSADDFKIQGDELFYLGKVEEALKCYSKAILMNPTDPLNFTNRAIAAFK